MLADHKRFYLPHYEGILKGVKRPYYLLQKQANLDLDNENLSLNEAIEKAEGLSRAIIEGSFSEGKGKVNLLRFKLQILKRMLKSCEFCERRCRVNRCEKLGSCGVPLNPRIASVFLHYGEEEELVPSLTVFYSGCNFRCVYCQNVDIARFSFAGEPFQPKRLAKIIEEFDKRAKNVNFVGGDPTPSAHHVFETLVESEFNLPVIWNSNMYQSLEVQKLLIGVVDLYLADFKYGNDDCALKLSGIKNYTKVVTRNLEIAINTADVIIRHLVLPGHLKCCTAPVLEWLAENYPEVNLNVMFQYHPCADARNLSGLDRVLSLEEKLKVLEMVRASRLDNARVG
jgi:putative pyruvate formate lyase activating enzyme